MVARDQSGKFAPTPRYLQLESALDGGLNGHLIMAAGELAILDDEGYGEPGETHDAVRPLMEEGNE